jgi:hypothetical protein
MTLTAFSAVPDAVLKWATIPWQHGSLLTNTMGPGIGIGGQGEACACRRCLSRNEPPQCCECGWDQRVYRYTWGFVTVSTTVEFLEAEGLTLASLLGNSAGNGG